MKITSKDQQEGGVLVVALITCLIIGIMAASYLTLISRRYNLAVRSVAWNSAMPVLEAGLEEAMAHLNADSNNPTANNWTATTISGQIVHTKQRQFTDGSYYKVTLCNAASDHPIIYSTGFVPAPLGKGYIARTVKVTASRTKAFSAAIATHGLIKLSLGATIDSYNSCLGNYTTNNWHGTNGSLATNLKGYPAMQINGAHVYGVTSTGPGGGIDITSGSIGDAEWNAAKAGIQPGWSSDTMNVSFATNLIPLGSFLPTTVLSLGGSNITQLGSGLFSMLNFTSDDSKKPMLVSGNAILYVIGNVTLTGTGYIRVLPGATLKMIVAGNNPILGGAGVINETGSPANFSYIGLPTNTKFTYSGAAAFVGTVNAPQADANVSGAAGFYGAVIAKTFTSNGGSSFHFDECLGAGGVLTITSWREL